MVRIHRIHYIILFILLSGIILFYALDKKKDDKISKADILKADTLFKNARKSERVAQFEKAIHEYDQSLQIYTKANLDTTASILLNKIVECLIRLGYNHRNVALYKKAMENIDRAKQLLENRTSENNLSLARCLDEKGMIYFKQNQFDEAHNHFQSAYRLRVKTVGASHPSIAPSHDKLGILYREKGNFKNALQHAKRALEIKYMSEYTSQEEIAHSLFIIGSIHRKSGDFVTAQEKINRSLAIYQDIHGENHPAIADCYLEHGIIEWKSGNYRNALKDFQNSLKIRLNFFKEDHPNVALSYYNLGIIYWKTGDLSKSIDYYKKAQRIYSTFPSNNKKGIANCYNGLGNSYSDKGDYKKAVFFYEKAYHLWSMIYGEKHPWIAVALNNLGEAHYRSGKFEDAISFFNRSFVLCEQLYGNKHARVASSLNNLALVYVKNGEHNRALTLFNKALTLYSQILGKKHPDIAETYLNIAKLYGIRNDFEKALYYCQMSIISLLKEYNNDSMHSNPVLQHIISNDHLLNALIEKASLLKNYQKENRLENLKSALKTFRLAAQLVDQTRLGYDSDDAKLSLGKKAAGVYSEAIDTAIELFRKTGQETYKEDAFFFSEKSKANVLMEALQESHAKKFAHIPEKILKEVQKLSEQLALYTTQIQMNDFRTDNNKAELHYDRSLQDKYFATQNQYEKIIKSIEKNFPEYFELKYQTSTPSVQSLQKILDARSVLLEFFKTDSSIFCFLITNQRYILSVSNCNYSVDSEIQTLIKSILKIEKEQFIESSSKLYKLLIEPVQKELKGYDRIVIIPAGKLFYVPFETLINLNPDFKWRSNQNFLFSELNYLIKNHSISYHYSASLYKKYLSSRKRVQNGNFIGFAPVFRNVGLAKFSSKIYRLLNAENGNIGTKNDMRIAGQKLNELKYSREEVQNIIALFHQRGRGGKSFFYTEASEANFKSQINDYQYIHVATHSMIKVKKPALSGIIFSPEEPDDSVEDGVLYSAETYNLRLNADLVVLSSCESGMGKLIEGEGVIALTRGFLYSGARNLIYSLWEVYDHLTSLLMVEFYSHVLQGDSYPKALRKARLKLISDESSAFPVKWGGFVLVGD